MRRRALAFVGHLGLAACGGGEGVGGAPGSDAAAAVDAAALPDGARSPDRALGPLDDATLPADAFAPRDAFAPPDARRPPDAFAPPDALAPADDALAPPDAFAPPDAGGCAAPPPTFPCGLNGRGTAPARCWEGAWVVGGRCADPDLCVDGTEGEVVCGERDALQAPARCDLGQWSFTGACVDRLCDAPTPAVVGENVAPEADIRSERGDCGGAGLERAFAFTPPADHRYRLSTQGLAYGAALYVRAVCETPAPELVCAVGPRGTPPHVDVDLTAGVPVTVIVDALGAHGGEIPLQISDICLSGEPLTDAPPARLPGSGDLPDFAVLGDELGALQAVAVPDGEPGASQIVFTRFALDGTPRSRPVVVSAGGLADGADGADGAAAGPAPAAVAPGDDAYALVVGDAGTPGGLRFLRFARADAADVPRVDVALPPVPGPALGPPAPAGLSLAPHAAGFVLVGTERETRTLWSLAVDPDGHPTGAAVVLAASVDPSHPPSVATLAGNPAGGFAVSWMTAAPEAPGPMFARFDAEGRPPGVPVALGQAEAPATSAARLAVSGDTVAAAFFARHAGALHLHVRRFDAAGVDLGTTESDPRFEASCAEPGLDAPALGAGPGYFGLGWPAMRADGERFVAFATLSAAGAPGPATARFESAPAAGGDLRLRGHEAGFVGLWAVAGADERALVAGRLACAPDPFAPEIDARNPEIE